jgi:hypothetical protein
MHPLIVDIKLSLIERTYSDVVLAELVTLKVRQAAKDARSARRLSEGEVSREIVYRLPVMLDWTHYPLTLSRFRSEAARVAETNAEAQQFILWSERFSHVYEATHDPLGSQSALYLNLDQLQEQELSGLLKNSGALFEHGKTALFHLPSDHLADYFLRVGNVQSKGAFFSATFFWLLPHIADIRHVLCDTWSISTTAATVAEYLQLYLQHPSDIASEVRVTWSFSPSYIPTSPLAGEIISDAFTAAQSQGGRLLVLSSFYSSGGLERSVVGHFDSDEELNQVALIAIYSSGKNFSHTHAILCDLEAEFASLELEGKRAQPEIGKVVLDIDRVSFFPDYREVERRKFLVRDADAFRDFFTRYSGREIFSVHRDGSSRERLIGTGKRHHAYHVDAGKLFSDPAFLERLRDRLSGCGQFDCVIANSTFAANALITAVQAVRPDLIAGAIFHTVDNWRLISENSDLISQINSSECRTLLLVPMVVTGSTIGDIKRHLREACLDSQKRHHYLIGLVRPDSLEVYRNYVEIGERFMAPSSVSVVESAIIPNLGSADCPWCRELDAISRLDRDLASTEAISMLDRRRLVLAGAFDSGLKGTNVFFTFPETDRLPFNGGSLFLDSTVAGQDDDELENLSYARTLVDLARSSLTSEADLCMAVATAVQMWRLRNDGRSVKRLAMDAATVINDDKFNEARLRAAIWRALHPSERELSIRVSSDFAAVASRIFNQTRDSSHTPLQCEAIISFGRHLRLHHKDLIQDPSTVAFGAFWSG